MGAKGNLDCLAWDNSFWGCQQLDCLAGKTHSTWESRFQRQMPLGQSCLESGNQVFTHVTLVEPLFTCVFFVASSSCTAVRLSSRSSGHLPTSIFQRIVDCFSFIGVW